MKKFISAKSVVFGLMLAGSYNANAQIDLGNILGNITNKNNSSAANSNDVISGLTSIFSSDKQATSSKLVGTWEYSEPAIVFQSDNILAKGAASLAASKIEDKLNEQLVKYGIKPGMFSITFEKDGTFIESFNTKKINGKWSIKDSKLNLTYGRKTISVTTQLSGKKLMFVTDATKLLDLVKTLGSKSPNSNIQTVTSLMKSIKGMEAGLTLVKKQ